MGAGASSTASSMHFVVTAMMIGHAIGQIQSEGIYTIYDFHSNLAPKLKISRHLSSNPFYMLQIDDEDEEIIGNNESDEMSKLYSFELSTFVCVEVCGDKIYIDDVLKANSSGWLPLHACSMSYATLVACLKIIDEMVKRGALHQKNVDGSLIVDTVTAIGPGAFNSGWSALQMACAYGVEPIVMRLVDIGANVNTTNSYDYTPLLEACRRGYVEIVMCLIESQNRRDDAINGKLDVDYLPDTEMACKSPFACSAPQRALAEATRAGHSAIVQVLLERTNVDINAANHIGWTALHEACFYNRFDVVKTLLHQSSCDPTLRTKHSKALPYHLANNLEIREYIDMHSNKLAVPTDVDKVDLMDILDELACFKTHIPRSGNNLNFCDTQVVNLDFRTKSVCDQIVEGSSRERNDDYHFSESDKRVNSSSTKTTTGESIYGSLPPLTSQAKTNSLSVPRVRADKDLTSAIVLDAEMPPKFLCDLSRRIMSAPMRSMYGHSFDRDVITRWFDLHGKICPLTGAPLSLADLTPLPDLAKEIQSHLVNKAMIGAGENFSVDSTEDGDDFVSFPNASRKNNSISVTHISLPITKERINNVNHGPGKITSGNISSGIVSEDDIYSF